MKTKICTKCEKELPSDEEYFYKQKLGLHGLRSVCRECCNERDKKYYKENVNKNRERAKRYHYKNKDKINKYRREYYKINKDKMYKRAIEYRNENVQAMLAYSLRKRLNSAVRSNQKSGSAVNDLGISTHEFKKYLESKFYNRLITGENMTWDNYGRRGWHIDHIIPLSFFDLSDREQFIEACHYTNLQPLWAEENFSKNNKILKDGKI